MSDSLESLQKKIADLELQNQALRRHVRKHHLADSKQLRHVGLFPERNQHNDLERAFAKTWERENARQRGIDFGHGILQQLMYKLPRGGHFMYDSVRMETINQRDAEIVATVIQWLGTNCGYCFLEECLNAVDFQIVKREDSTRFSKHRAKTPYKEAKDGRPHAKAISP